MELPEFPYNTVQDRSKEALVPKTSPVRISAISIELQLVTDTGRSKYPLRHTVPIVYGAVIMAELHVLQKFVWIIYRLTTGECLGFFYTFTELTRLTFKEMSGGGSKICLL